MISLQKAQCTDGTNKRVVGICPTIRNYTGEKMIVLLAFLAHLKDTLDNCGVCEGKTVQF